MWGHLNGSAHRLPLCPHVSTLSVRRRPLRHGVDLFWAGQVSGGRSVKVSSLYVCVNRRREAVWRLCVRVCVCACVCAPPGEKRTPNLFFWLSFKGRARHTRGCLWSAAPSIPHFLSPSLLHPSFPRFHHLSLVPSAFSPRFLGPPSLCSLICCVGPLWSLYGDGSHLQILPKSSDST